MDEDVNNNNFGNEELESSKMNSSMKSTPAVSSGESEKLASLSMQDESSLSSRSTDPKK